MKCVIVVPVKVNDCRLPGKYTKPFTARFSVYNYIPNNLKFIKISIIKNTKKDGLEDLSIKDATYKYKIKPLWDKRKNEPHLNNSHKLEEAIA